MKHIYLFIQLKAVAFVCCW